MLSACVHLLQDGRVLSPRQSRRPAHSLGVQGVAKGLRRRGEAHRRYLGAGANSLRRNHATRIFLQGRQFRQAASHTHLPRRSGFESRRVVLFRCRLLNQSASEATAESTGAAISIGVPSTLTESSSASPATPKTRQRPKNISSDAATKRGHTNSTRRWRSSHGGRISAPWAN